MSGLRSRRRGYRGEYQLRDFLRERGWTANRVPSSGAAQGFKGDLVAERAGVKLVLVLALMMLSFVPFWFSYLTEE